MSWKSISANFNIKYGQQTKKGTPPVEIKNHKPIKIRLKSAKLNLLKKLLKLNTFLSVRLIADKMPKTRIEPATSRFSA